MSANVLVMTNKVELKSGLDSIFDSKPKVISVGNCDIVLLLQSACHCIYFVSEWNWSV